ncbi:MAG: ribosome biogenesis GTP-binding protein YihA/YsxC [Oscillospiraceae bacterium]|nr:ribosome biogenesis GTP-binding protein YihA/YsxC [Oscillospiraceae bacterium]
MLIRNPQFEISAVEPKQYPNKNIPEIVLVGKSNVGKSSFINTLINRKNLARTSSEPGKTRQINFYNMDDKFYFVDLPGYGYSKMSKELQEKAGKFIEEYLFNRPNISLIIHILDIRHDPTKDDILMHNYLKSTNKPFVIIANKADKIASTKVDLAVESIREKLGLSEEISILPFSSEKKIYTDEVWNKLDNYLSI